MKRVILGMLLAMAAWAQDQPGPAAYQPILVKFRVVDLDGRPLETASVAARLDPESTRLPPDHVLKAKSGADEFTYTLGESAYPIFSSQQHTGPEGFAEAHLIVYSNRPGQPIDYELMVLYKEANRNVLYSADSRKSFTNADDGKLIVLHANIRRQVGLSSLAIAILAWLGLTVMGFLLFFRGMYRRWLANGRSIELSRAWCWSGTLFICLLAMGLVYWWLLPRIFGLWIFFGLLFAIWLAHLLVSVGSRRQVA